MARVLGRRLLRGLGGGLPAAAAAAGGLLLLPGPAARAEEAADPGCGCGGGEDGEAAGGVGERPGAERHSAKWRVFTDMARDRAREGNHAEAERLLTAALEEARRGFGADDYHVAAAQANLADLLRLRGDPAGAEKLYLEALELLEASELTPAPSLGMALHNVGAFYLAQRDLGAARNYFIRALNVKTAALGEAHPETSLTLAHLAEVYRLLGDEEEAAALLRRSVEILDELHQSGSPAAAKRLSQLSKLLLAAGRTAEAEPVLRRLVENLEDAQGAGTGRALQAGKNLAAALIQAEGDQRAAKVAEGRRILEAALRTERARPTPDGLLVPTLALLSQAALAQGRPREALDFADEAFERAQPGFAKLDPAAEELTRRTFPPVMNVCRALRAQGQALAAAGDAAGAGAKLREAAAILEKYSRAGGAAALREVLDRERRMLSDELRLL